MLQKNVWKNFPEILLSHKPDYQNFNVFLILDFRKKVSRKSPDAFLKIANKGEDQKILKACQPKKAKDRLKCEGLPGRVW